MQKILKIPLKKHLETINHYSKVTGYKINIQISFSFLYTTNKLEEKEILKFHFLSHQKRIKYLLINLTEELMNFYNNIVKGIEEDTKEWKNTSCS